jgi:hypothetical protein
MVEKRQALPADLGVRVMACTETQERKVDPRRRAKCGELPRRRGNEAEYMLCDLPREIRVHGTRR